MTKLLLVARKEYLRLVRRRAFLLATLGVPLLIGGIIGLSIFISVTRGASDLPLGYVDQAGVLRPEVLASDAGNEIGAALLPFATAAEATSALERGEIQAYYLLPPEYLSTRRMQLIYWDDEPSDSRRSQFRRFVRLSLVAEQPPEVQQRLLRGVDLKLLTADGEKKGSAEEIINFFLPFIIGMFFVFVVMSSAGFLLRAVSTEKENRMVEVMFTSLAPSELIVGKSVGLMAVALTQVVIWLAALAAAVLIGDRFFPILEVASISGRFLALVVLFFLPTYALIAGLMFTIGSMVADQQQGQQVAGMLNLLFVFPFFFMVLIFTSPDSPILTALTLFPTTAFVTVTMRWGVTTIPAWQLALSWLILATTAALSIVMATRVFRVGMLRYGQPLRLKGLVQVLRKGEA